MQPEPLHRDSLLHGLIDEAAFGQHILPLMHTEPLLCEELVRHLVQDGENLLAALSYGETAAIIQAAESLVCSADGLTAVRLADIARRIATGDRRHIGILRPLLLATAAELRQRCP